MAKPTEAAARDRNEAPNASFLAGGSLGQRLFLLTAGLVVLAVVSSVLVTRILGSRVADRAVAERLERSTAVQSDLADDRLDQLYLRSLIVSGDPNFVTYVIEAIRNGDSASLSDQLDERQRDMGFDFAIVVDSEGMTLARTDVRGGRQDLSDTPLFRTAMGTGEYGADGLWNRDDGLYYSVLVPLLTASQVLEGFLITAYELNDETALQLRGVTGTEVTFVVDRQADGTPAAEPSIVATTLDPPAEEAFVRWLGTSPEADGEARQAEIGETRYLATLRPVSNAEGEVIGQVVNLASLEAALAPFQRIGQILGIVGIFAVLLALAASWLLPRKLLAPVRSLASAAEAAAEGNLDQDIAGTERGDEVGQLAGAFSTLLSELREKRDMQVYLTELTRTLPDQQEGPSGNEAEPARSRSASLVGFELRAWTGTVPPHSAATEVLELLARQLRRVSRAISAKGGRIEASAGHRLLASFDGDQHAVRALAAAAEALSAEPRLAVALVSGEATTGTISWQNRPTPALTGAGTDALEDLLRVARPGTLLMTAEAHGLLISWLGETGLSADQHQTQWSQQPLYSLDSQRIAHLASPEVSQTVEMSTRHTVVGTTTASIAGRTTLAAVGPGSVLADRFEILSELGAGGMGIVYKARDRELHELVALKMLKAEAFAGDAAALEGLKGELRMARKISHPNVLRTFDFGEADGFPFISMEFVRGVTLKHLLEQSGRLPLSAGLHMARQLCRGLQAAHSQSVLHRDIKPENMIIEPTGNVKLMDFGIAQPIRRGRDDGDVERQIVGTPFYLSPEQLEGKEPDVRADIYACGVVFYEIFTGQLPFPGGNLMQILGRKINEDAPPPSSAWPEIPPRLEDLILRCLQRDRTARFPDVDSLLHELEQLRV